MDNEARLYEIGYQLLPTLTEEALAGEVALMRSLVEQQGGEVESVGLPKLRDLAYPMMKKIANKNTNFSQAHFGYFHFRIAPEAVSVVKEKFATLENVLRFLLTETIKPQPSHHPKEVKEVSEVGTAPTPATEVKEPAKEEPEHMSSEEMDKKVDELIAETA